jgi:hypothetical protein
VLPLSNLTQTVRLDLNTEWRAACALASQGITFDTFFGGSDESWRTPVDTSICFKGFRVEVCME